MPLQEKARRIATAVRIADHDRHDVAFTRQHRQASSCQQLFQPRGMGLMLRAQILRSDKSGKTGPRAGGDDRRQRCREDKAGRKAAHEIDQQR